MNPYQWTLQRSGYRPASVKVWCSASALLWWGGSPVHPELWGETCPRPRPPGCKEDFRWGWHTWGLQKASCFVTQKRFSRVQPVRGSCREAPEQIPQSCAESCCWELSLWTCDWGEGEDGRYKNILQEHCLALNISIQFKGNVFLTFWGWNKCLPKASWQTHYSWCHLETQRRVSPYRSKSTRREIINKEQAPVRVYAEEPYHRCPSRSLRRTPGWNRYCTESWRSTHCLAEETPPSSHPWSTCWERREMTISRLILHPPNQYAALQLIKPLMLPKHRVRYGF